MWHTIPVTLRCYFHTHTLSYSTKHISNQRCFMVIKYIYLLWLRKCVRPICSDRYLIRCQDFAICCDCVHVINNSNKLIYCLLSRNILTKKAKLSHYTGAFENPCGILMKSFDYCMFICYTTLLCRPGRLQTLKPSRLIGVPVNHKMNYLTQDTRIWGNLKMKDIDNEIRKSKDLNQ